MKNKLFLIDGTAIIYRSFFAFIRNPLYNSKGQNTSAIYGTINAFLRMMDRYNLEHVAISFDRREKTFRHEITETYKANRPPAPEELHQQVEPIKEFFHLIGLKEISCAGYEADDVLATLAEKYKSEYDVIIVTGDKDFAQLVDDDVKLYDPSKEVVLDEKAIIEKYGLKPEQFIDYLAICGDAADNIPGVKGIGPKGAEKLLQEFRTLENIYQNIENISAKGTQTKLLEHKEEAFLSQKLATIVRDVPLDIADDRTFFFDKTKLVNSLPLLKEFELNSIAKKIQSNSNTTVQNKAETKQQEYKAEFDFMSNDKTELPPVEAEKGIKFEAILVENEAEFRQMLTEISAAPIVALDTETTSTDPLLAKLVGISLCSQPDKAYYISVAHQMADNVPAEIVLPELQKALAGKLIIAHNFKYDYLVLQRAGWKIENEIFDTMIADYLLRPTSRHALDACSKEEFDHEMIPIKNLIGVGQKQITFDLVPTGQAAEYSAEDADVTFRLYKIFESKLIRSNLYNLFKNIEMPLVYALAKMEENGVKIDVKILDEMSKANQKQLGELTKKIYEIAGSQFNINSTQQLGKVLFEDLGIPPVKKTKTGFSTDVVVLEKLAKDYEIARLLMEYRTISKLESTYVTALPKLVNPVTGRVHSSFNQTVASTGRLSSTNPNMQNIPVRSEMGKEIRYAFVAGGDDRILVAADYSQIELRILAMLSQDEKMINAFRQKKDIHSETAGIIYEIPQEQVTSDQRRYAKIINFGLMYGMGAFRVSNELNISRQEAQQFIDSYFSKFPTIRNYIQESIETAKRKGYAETIFGRKLWLPELNSSNKMRIAEAERVATNMPIQGSAADIIKIAMINLHNKIKDNNDIKMIIQVHDELVFEVKRTKLEEAKNLIKTEMESALPAAYSEIVPLVVDIGVGVNWFEAH
ncbi:MAG TPA: DNA polymerase I [Candidatus Cloacimonadota bacterium]|nr:DNA polymerase I [Candidatus Cloacimonadota bacterium]